MKTKKIYLMGGFGNNLFQINKGFEYADKGCNVIYNDFLIRPNFFSDFLGWSSHSNELGHIVFENINVESNFHFLDFIYLFVFFIAKKLLKINIQSYNWEPETYIQIGYWQDSAILNKSFIDYMRTCFLSYRNNVDIPYESVVLHARLGDFSDVIQLPFKYYADCVFKSNCKSIIVVTDTPEFFNDFKSYLESIGWHGIIKCSNTKSAFDDFLLLSFTNSLIMSNSTFCYWASQILPVNNVYFPIHRRLDVVWPFQMSNLNKFPINSFG